MMKGREKKSVKFNPKRDKRQKESAEISGRGLVERISASIYDSGAR
jgi:hypothetical protein